MTNKEKEIIRNLIPQIKDLYKYRTKNELIRFLDYTILIRKALEHTDEFMEKLYFIRYYVDKVAC